MKTYFSLLDAVRFFAAFWVMNFHYFLGTSSKLSWYRYGNLGVQLFFIVSGFVIVQSLNGKTLKEFATSRFLRLFPLFWILCTVTYIITLIIPSATHVSFVDYLKSMTMLGDIFEGYLGYGSLVDPSYWTLTIELLFYTLIGVFTFFFSYKNIRYFLAFWLVLSAITFAYGIDTDFFIKLLLVRHASYFVFGSALALIVSQAAQTVFTKYFDKALLLTSALYSIFIHPRALPEYALSNPLDTPIVTLLHILFFISIIALVYLSQFVTNKKTIYVLTVLGGITYPLYLLHQKIGNTVLYFMKYTSDVDRNIFIISFEVIVILFSYILYTQDKRMRTWLYNRFFTH